jgi:hypothetical protein
MELDIGCHQLKRDASGSVSNNRNDSNSTVASNSRDAIAAVGTPATTLTWVKKEVKIDSNVVITHKQQKQDISEPLGARPPTTARILPAEAMPQLEFSRILHNNLNFINT